MVWPEFPIPNGAESVPTTDDCASPHHALGMVFEYSPAYHAGVDCLGSGVKTAFGSVLSLEVGDNTRWFWLGCQFQQW